jgi:hypothetical protein
MRSCDPESHRKQSAARITTEPPDRGYGARNHQLTGIDPPAPFRGTRKESGNTLRPGLGSRTPNAAIVAAVLLLLVGLGWHKQGGAVTS